MFFLQLVALSSLAGIFEISTAHPQGGWLSRPRQSFKRAGDSPDNTCGIVSNGANKGYVCGSSNSGPCCSQYGFCGNTAAYCGSGCQSAYGTCDSGQGTNDDLCGPQNNNQVCSNNMCCSPAGYCGTTKDYCQSPDCLRGFGRCDADLTPSGDTTKDVLRPELGSVGYGVDIYDCEEPGAIALTFDDGPYLYTADLLDLLASRGVPATFFVTGVNLGKGEIDDPSTPWPAILRRMIAEGHQIASHSWSHADLSTLNESDRESEVIKLEMALRNVIGKWPTYFRPPFSSCNAACVATLKKYGYHIVYFDLDTEDYLHATPDTIQISKNIVLDKLSAANPAKDDYLSIMHDIHDQTAHNLTAYFLDTIKAKGFKAVTLGECLGDPETNWYRSSAIASTTTTSSTTSSSTTSTDPASTTASTTSTTSTESTTDTTPTSTPTTSTTPTPTPTTSTTPTPTPTTPTTKRTTTNTPVPTNTCTTYSIGKWCAPPIAPFTTKSGCQNAYKACKNDVTKCVLQAGILDVFKCPNYQKDVCNPLNQFCKKCLKDSCNSADFKPVKKISG